MLVVGKIYKSRIGSKYKILSTFHIPTMGNVFLGGRILGENEELSIWDECIFDRDGNVISYCFDNEHCLQGEEGEKMFEIGKVYKDVTGNEWKVYNIGYAYVLAKRISDSEKGMFRKEDGTTAEFTPPDIADLVLD